MLDFIKYTGCFKTEFIGVVSRVTKKTDSFCEEKKESSLYFKCRNNIICLKHIEYIKNSKIIKEAINSSIVTNNLKIAKKNKNTLMINYFLVRNPDKSLNLYEKKYYYNDFYYIENDFFKCLLSDKTDFDILLSPKEKFNIKINDGEYFCVTENVFKETLATC